MEKAKTAFYGKGGKKNSINVFGRRKAESATRARLLNKINPNDELVYHWGKKGLTSDPLFDVAQEDVLEFAPNGIWDDEKTAAKRGGCWFCMFATEAKKAEYPEAIRNFYESMARTRDAQNYCARKERDQEFLDKGQVAGKLKLEVRWDLYNKLLDAERDSGVRLLGDDERDYIENYFNETIASQKE